jgi:hypothetical protein
MIILEAVKKLLFRREGWGKVFLLNLSYSAMMYAGFVSSDIYVVQISK